ncbi:hypothetical protein STEG23_025562 [Scotinomys teguina]
MYQALLIPHGKSYFVGEENGAFWYSIVYMYYIFLIHSSVEGHLGCFQVLPITNNAAMNIVEHVSLWLPYVIEEYHWQKLKEVTRRGFHSFCAFESIMIILQFVCNTKKLFMVNS